MSIDKIAPYAKAVTAALVACLSALGAALADGEITGQEGVTAALALLVGLSAVWAVPNKPAAQTVDAPTPPPPPPASGPPPVRSKPTTLQK